MTDDIFYTKECLEGAVKQMNKSKTPIPVTLGKRLLSSNMVTEMTDEPLKTADEICDMPMAGDVILDKLRTGAIRWVKAFDSRNPEAKFDPKPVLPFVLSKTEDVSEISKILAINHVRSMRGWIIYFFTLREEELK